MVEGATAVASVVNGHTDDAADALLLSPRPRNGLDGQL